MKINLYILLCITMVMLSACGGGSSSGADAANFADDGVYQGSQKLRFTTLDGELLQESEFAFSLSVFEQEVTIFDPSFSAQAPINNGVLEVSSAVLNETQDEISCDIAIIYNGTVDSGTAQGTIQGNYNCTAISGSAEGEQFIFPLEGTFTSTRSAVASKVSLLNDVRVDMDIIVDQIRSAQ